MNITDLFILHAQIPSTNDVYFFVLLDTGEPVFLFNGLQLRIHRDYVSI